MVHLRGMVHEGWYMVHDGTTIKIMVRSGNAGAILLPLLLRATTSVGK